ncbi:MAG: DMT family transporter [Marinifilaceae bacterium]|jgi:drug/metabolite transporter (DMT)-like permease|nr:DMT family transporter [Marinifilaceae bacterium]
MKKYLLSTSFLAILACLLWATPFTAIKIGLKYTSPLYFAGLRFFISGLILLPFAGGYKSIISSVKNHRSYILSVAIFQTTLLYGLFYTGVDLVPGALGAMLIGAQPLFASIMAHLMLKNDKMNLKKTIAVLVGVVGVCIISLGRKDFDFKSTIPLGVLILVLNNIVGSTGNIIVSKYANRMPAIQLASFSMLAGGLFLIFGSQFIENPILKVDYPSEFYISLIWLAIVSATSISVWFALLGRPGVKVSNLNTWKFIIPLFGACLSWLILPNESPDTISILGMIVISISLLMVNYINRNK